jgi:hypothetical protein
MARCKYQGQFGKLVIGEEEALAEVKAAEGGKDVYGKLVTDAHGAAPLPAPDPDPEGVVVKVEAEEVVEHDSLSVRKVRDEVRGEVATSTIDRLMRSEFMRPDGARKSVLEILRSKEAGREHPRDEVLTALEAKIAEA